MIKTRRRRVMAFIFWMIVAFACAYGAVWTVMQKNHQDKKQSSWPQHTGIVISSSASVQIGSENSPNKIRTKVNYRYEIDSVQYRNDQEWFASCEFSCSSKAEERERKYSPGSSTTIFVDPVNDANGLINPLSGGGGIGDWGQLVMLIFGFSALRSGIAAFAGADLPWNMLKDSSTT